MVFDGGCCGRYQLYTRMGSPAVRRYDFDRTDFRKWLQPFYREKVQPLPYSRLSQASENEEANAVV